MKRLKRYGLGSVATLAVATLSLLVMGVWGGAAPSLVGHATAAAGVGTASAKGIYAFSLSTHDPMTGQEGAGVGTIVFDGVGNVSGTISETERFPTACTTCGDLLVQHATYTGTYDVRPDGSTTLDICISNPSGPVKAELEGAFSNAFRNLRLVVTEIAAPCNGTLEQVPNITSGTADKL